MQHRVEKAGPLLKEDGSLREAGYATSPLLRYDRNAVAASALRIKEWDYYLVLCDTHALALTIADNAYMGLDSVSLLDFTGPWAHTASRIRLLPMGKTGLPASSEAGDTAVSRRRYRLGFSHEGGARLLRVRMERFADGQTIEGEIRLTDAPQDSMVVATPFAENHKAFYYNQKINCMRAEGEVRLGGKVFPFKPETSFGTLDWGRGVWTYRNTWYWGSCSGLAEGAPFGLNLGYGFGDTSAASENMIFFEGRGHKLSKVVFEIPLTNGREDFMRPWRVTSGDHRLALDFMPVIDRASKMSLGILSSDQHQVFGRFMGKAVLGDGRVLSVGGLTGFMEKVTNKW